MFKVDNNICCAVYMPIYLDVYVAMLSKSPDDNDSFITSEVRD